MSQKESGIQNKPRGAYMSQEEPEKGRRNQEEPGGDRKAKRR